MKNEPVAWMDEETGCFVYSQYDYKDLDEHGKDGLIPLYTHPVKEDEIEKVRIAIMNTAHWCADENMPEAYNAVKLCCSEVLAILRKAQEK